MEKACSIKHVCTYSTLRLGIKLFGHWGRYVQYISYVGVGGGGEVNVVTIIHTYVCMCLTVNSKIFSGVGSLREEKDFFIFINNFPFISFFLSLFFSFPFPFLFWGKKKRESERETPKKGKGRK